MNINRIENLLAKCDLEDLRSIERTVGELIAKASEKQSEGEGTSLKNLRKEERFTTNIHANLVRITDVRPNERKEYSVTVKDISRSGMCFLVDSNFVPSRIVELTFAGPGGRIKRCCLEIVRLRKLYESTGSMLEVGCRSISAEDLRRARLHEERIAKMRSKLHNKKNIIVLVVGPDTKETEQIQTRVKQEEYQVRKMKSVSEALASGEKISAQLLIITEGGKLLKEPDQLACLKTVPACLATLAVTENDTDRFELFKSGVDECLMAKNVEEFLLHSIERALISHSIRQQPGIELMTPTAMVFSRNSMRINLVSYRLEEQGFKCRVVGSLKEAGQYHLEDFHLILADFDAESKDEFVQLCQEFNMLPVIAMCERMDMGHLAMSHGAQNYLSMPPSREDILMILEGYLMQKK
jgi:DNA-binding response OmpR family regulator